MARLVVDLAGRALDRLEYDVLVEARGHARRGARAATSSTGSSCTRAASFFQATISSSRSVWTTPIAAVNSFSRKFRPWLRVVGLAVVAEAPAPVRAPRGASTRACRPRRSRWSWSARTTRCPTSPHVPAATPFQDAPCEWAQSSSRTIPLASQSCGDPLDVEGDMAADMHEEDGARLVLVRSCARGRRTTCRGRRGCSRRTRRGPRR